MCHSRALRFSFIILLAVLTRQAWGQACVAPAACGVTVESGNNTMQFLSSNSSPYALQITSSVANEEGAYEAQPVRIYVCEATQITSPSPMQCPNTDTGIGAGFSSSPALIRGYDTVSSSQANVAMAQTTIHAPNGETFVVSDFYLPGQFPGSFTMKRMLTESTGSASSSDTGFNSQFVIGFKGTALPISNYHFFAPGIWYDKNVHAATTGIGTDVENHSYFYWRETRSPLPLIMIQDPTTGAALSVAHTGADGTGAPSISSGLPESSLLWYVDSSVQYGALGVEKIQGIQNNPVVTVGFIYPADEGDVTYLSATPNTWVRRSTPVAASGGTSTQQYTLNINLGSSVDSNAAPGATDVADYPQAMQSAWRSYFVLYSPPLKADVAFQVMTAGVNLLQAEYKQFSGIVAGFPFSMAVDGSSAPAYTFQMGYVGEQIPLSWQLMYYGLSTDDNAPLQDGVNIVDFWSTQDPLGMISNLPLAWYNPNAASGNEWVQDNCNNPIFLRMVSDGMEGVVESAIIGRQHPVKIGAHSSWEAFANQYATWLVSNQTSDGTWSRAYNPDGSVWTQRANCIYTAGSTVLNVDGSSPLNSTFPIRFLVDMWFATKNPTYEQAALKAGDWAYTNVYQATTFTGGITSTNSIDRESGVQALHAALALYDMVSADATLTNQAQLKTQWLEAAELAGSYVETWQYIWNFPVRDNSATGDDPGGQFPQYVYAGPMSLSVSNVGSPAMDIYLAIAAFDFYRLHLLAGEPAGSGHYARVAQLLANNTKLTTQLPVANQNFGWLQNGMATEAVNVSSMELNPLPKGGAAINWVPWLTNTEMDSEFRLWKAFDSFSVSQLLSNELTPANYQQYVTDNKNIYPAPGSLGWTNP